MEDLNTKSCRDKSLIWTVKFPVLHKNDDDIVKDIKRELKNDGRSRSM